ncbi:MAG: hypothetical protein QOH22_539, partial [Gemmatimonadaceae bacterium]|nr:hypothetical protein [Gemmatimonadaceae bacterium]
SFSAGVLGVQNWFIATKNSASGFPETAGMEAPSYDR